LWDSICSEKLFCSFLRRIGIFYYIQKKSGKPYNNGKSQSFVKIFIKAELGER
jgi:hypothetical protein